MRVTKAFTVEQRGIGKPDYTKEIAVGIAGGISRSIQNVETTTPLGIGETFIGQSRDCEFYADFAVSCRFSMTGTGTLYVENSRDGIAWRTHDTVPVSALIPVNRTYSVTMRYNRVRYTNGGVAQFIFELVTLQRPLGG